MEKPRLSRCSEVGLHSLATHSGLPVTAAGAELVSLSERIWDPILVFLIQNLHFIEILVIVYTIMVEKYSSEES